MPTLASHIASRSLAGIPTRYEPATVGDGVGAAHGVRQRIDGGQVAGDELDAVPAQVLGRRRVADERDDRVAAGDEAVDERAADEAGAARDDDAHRWAPGP